MRYQIAYQLVRELEDKMLDSLETLPGDSYTSSVTVHSFQTISFLRYVRSVAESERWIYCDLTVGAKPSPWRPFCISDTFLTDPVFWSLVNTRLFSQSYWGRLERPCVIPSKPAMFAGGVAPGCLLNPGLSKVTAGFGLPRSGSG